MTLTEPEHGTVGQDGQGNNTFDFGSRAKLVWYKRQKENIPDFLPTPGGPWTVKFEPTPFCNFRCHTCPYQAANETQRGYFQQRNRQLSSRELGLSSEIVLSTLKDLRQGGHTRGIIWSGGGEPLVWPGLNEAILASAEFADVYIQTNALLLDKLIKHPNILAAVKLLSVSLYGSDNDTYC